MKTCGMQLLGRASAPSFLELSLLKCLDVVSTCTSVLWIPLVRMDGPNSGCWPWRWWLHPPCSRGCREPPRWRFPPSPAPAYSQGQNGGRKAYLGENHISGESCLLSPVFGSVTEHFCTAGNFTCLLCASVFLITRRKIIQASFPREPRGFVNEHDKVLWDPWLKAQP